MAFIDHVEMISGRLESIMRERYGLDTSKSTSPMKKTEKGIFMGVFAKVKNPIVRAGVERNPNRLRCGHKLTCVYHTLERSGLSFRAHGSFQLLKREILLHVYC